MVRAGPGNAARILDTADQTERFVLGGHSAPVTAAVFSPDGRHILTGSEDGTARLWDAATGSALGVMRSARSAIRSVAFAGDGSEAMVLSEGGTLRQYQIFATLGDLARHAKKTLPRRLTRDQRAQLWLPPAAGE
jgi:WD40 repeat protein